MTAFTTSRSTSPAAHPANVDAGELEKFGALAHHWWDPDSAMFGPLHRMNPLRLDWIDRMCGGLAGKRVVDVGCGGGILTEAMASRGAVALGIDLGDKALGVAKLHKLESGVAVDFGGLGEGICAVAVTIKDYAGKVVGALTMLAPSFRMLQERLEMEIIPSMRESAEILSMKFGYVKIPV